MLRSAGFSITSIVLAITILAPNGFAEQQMPEPGDTGRPNIVLILADDLGYNDISLNGNPIVDTPNIDGLARDGARFVTGYSAHSTCSPARAALMTGRFPHRFGYEFVRTSDGFVKAFDGTYPTEDEAEFRELPARTSEEEAGLPHEEITIAELLKSRGYRTGIFGKWHLGTGPSHWPNTHGFDEFVGIPGGSAMFSPLDDDWSVDARLTWSGIDNYLWEALPFMMIENGKRVVPEGYLTDVLADRAVKFVTAESDAPFFLYLSFNAPHNPLDAPKEIYDRLSHISDHKTRVYYAMIESMDAAIGRVLQALEATGKHKDTLVVFTSDNGGAWYTHIPMHNLPYRGWKNTFFEGGINVPLLVRWPNQIAPGRIMTQPAGGIDIMPTFAAAAGAALPEDRKIDGINLLPGLAGEESQAERVFYWSSGGYKALRQGEWKLQTQASPKQEWLFNLAVDPTEQINLAGTHKDKAKALRRLLDEMSGQMMAPSWPSPYRIKMRVGPYVEPGSAQPEWVWSN